VAMGPNPASAEEVQQLKSEVATQRQMIEELKAMVKQLATTSVEQANAIREVMPLPTLQEATLTQPEGKPAEKKPPRDAFEWKIKGATLQIYGHGDVSYDYVDNGQSFATNTAPGPGGTNVLAGQGDSASVAANARNGWMSQISSNSSYLGFRGSRPFNHYLTGLFQIETEVNFSGTPGPTSDLQCKQCLGSRDTYVGMQGPWGAVKIGKSDAPYKKASAALDPFLNTVGDSRSIMGNSGGDNRAEFATRLSHSIWYESPVYKGFNLAVLFSPGQNRSVDNVAYARGEPNCSAGNGAYTLSEQNQANGSEPAFIGGLQYPSVQTSGIAPCNDGSWGNVVSTSLAYKGHGFYVFYAFEYHKDVNRDGDYVGSGAPGSSVADEDAWKVGVQYNFKKTNTTANFVYEKLRRLNNPAFGSAVAIFDERSRPNATWMALTQKLHKKDEVSIGWAYGGRTPGDPDWGASGGLLKGIDNASNLYDIGYKHWFIPNKMSFYVVGARQANDVRAHYDLGAVGHGITVDKYNWTGHGAEGTRLQAVSGGMTYDF
jgi:predicted porin